MDIRELINLDDVMEELGLSPNGGLMYCMECPFLTYFLAFLLLSDGLRTWKRTTLNQLCTSQGVFWSSRISIYQRWIALIVISRHLEENLNDWLAEGVKDYLDDDYLVFDCPDSRKGTHISSFVWRCQVRTKASPSENLKESRNITGIQSEPMLEKFRKIAARGC